MVVKVLRPLVCLSRNTSSDLPNQETNR